MTSVVGPYDLQYRLPWRSRSSRSGAHRSMRAGSGGAFRDLAGLLEHPDPRRIDMRQSLRDPFQNLYVRRFYERSSICVAVLVDVSRSMSFAGSTRKMTLAVELVRVLSASARIVGDTFMLAGFDRDVQPDLYFPASRSRAREQELIAQLEAFVPRQSGAIGLVTAATMVPLRRSLVFVVTDLHIAVGDLEAGMSALSAHDIVPIVLSDSSESTALPDHGLLAITDLESGARRLVLMRPSLKRAWQARLTQRRAEIATISAQYGREPVEFEDSIDWERLAVVLSRGA